MACTVDVKYCMYVMTLRIEAYCNDAFVFSYRVTGYETGTYVMPFRIAD
jgi:hypothetical protein